MRNRTEEMPDLAGSGMGPFQRNRIGAVLATAVLCGALVAQPPARAQFEAASIKPSFDNSVQAVRLSPGRLTATATLRLLMQNAYSVQPFQIVNAPAWTGSDRFAIEANAASSAGRADVIRMLQSLLEDRFQLRVHRESRELPVYALVAARGGLKLGRPAAGACADPPPGTPEDWAGGRIQAPGGEQAPLPRCGSVRVRLASSGALMEGGNVPMGELARSLSMVMGRSVVDRTGFQERFDVHLTFLPDESTEALPPPPPGRAELLDARVPPLITALQQQLGLRLEAARAPVEVIVVDHVEKPSPN